MSVGRKIRNSVQTFRGRIAESVGRSTGDRRLEQEGRADRSSGSLKQAGEKAKDAFKHRP
ncbi:CsbD family protein [Streptomyces sp. NPDC054796]